MDAVESLVPDRPLRLMEMFAATFRYMRRNPAATLGVGALLSTLTSTVAGVVWNGLLYGGGSNSELARLLGGESLTVTQANAASQQITDAAPLLALIAAVSVLVQFAAMGVMTLGMVQALRGEKVQPATLWRAVPWRRILGVNLAIVAFMLVAAAIPITLAVVLGGAWGLFALACAAGSAVVIALLTALAVPAAVKDGYRVREALRRSIAVTRPGLFAVAWALFASTIVWQTIGSFVANPIAGLVGLLAGGPGTAAGAALTSLLSGIVSGAVSLPAIAGMTTLIYVDRARRLRA